MKQPFLDSRTRLALNVPNLRLASGKQQPVAATLPKFDRGDSFGREAHELLHPVSEEVQS